jgi:hypothetical protein
MDAALLWRSCLGLCHARPLLARLRRGVQHALDHLVAATGRFLGRVLVIKVAFAHLTYHIGLRGPHVQATGEAGGGFASRS